MDIIIVIHLLTICLFILLHVLFPYRKKKIFKETFATLVHHGKIAANKPHPPHNNNNNVYERFVQLTVPKKWFSYFYLWGLVWTILVISCVNAVQYNYCQNSTFFTVIHNIINILYYPSTNLANLLETTRGGEEKTLSFDVQIVLFFMFLHQARRCFECFYLTHFGDSRIHLGHFIYGLFYYTSFPLLTLRQTTFTDHVTKGLEWYHGLALLLYIWASWHQHICHLILASLKRDQLTSGRYSLPQGDLFQYLVCPHYFTEVLIYCSLFICSGVRNYFLLLPLFSALLSLSIVARETRVWYLRNFKEFPPKKASIIPYLC